MKIAAAFALLLATPAVAQTAPEPPSIFELHPVYVSGADSAFFDTRSLVRNGDTVEGWNLNIYSRPTQIAGHMTEAHWTRFRMSCSGMSASATWVIGRNQGATSFKTLLGMNLAVDRGTGWDRIHDYACRNVSVFKVKPYTSEATAIAHAKEAMR